MPTTPAVLAARDALDALFEPLHAFFHPLHRAYAHLVGPAVGDRSFSLFLTDQREMYVLPPSTDGWAAPRSTALPYLDAARAAGLSGHATAHLVFLVQHAVEAVSLAAPCARVPGTAVPLGLPADAVAVFHQNPYDRGLGAPSFIGVVQGALQGKLLPPDGGHGDLAWRLALLAALASPGRRHRYFLEGGDRRAWADTAEDAALLLAATMRHRGQAESFLSEPVTLWTHPIELPPAGPLPW